MKQAHTAGRLLFTDPTTGFTDYSVWSIFKRIQHTPGVGSWMRLWLSKALAVLNSTHADHSAPDLEDLKEMTKALNTFLAGPCVRQPSVACPVARRRAPLGASRPPLLPAPSAVNVTGLQPAARPPLYQGLQPLMMAGCMPPFGIPPGFGGLAGGMLSAGMLSSGMVPGGTLPGGTLSDGMLPGGTLPGGVLPSGMLPGGMLSGLAAAAASGTSAQSFGGILSGLATATAAGTSAQGFGSARCQGSNGGVEGAVRGALGGSGTLFGEQEGGLLQRDLESNGPGRAPLCSGGLWSPHPANGGIPTRAHSNDISEPDDNGSYGQQSDDGDDADASDGGAVGGADATGAAASGRAITPPESNDSAMGGAVAGRDAASGDATPPTRNDSINGAVVGAGTAALGGGMALLLARDRPAPTSHGGSAALHSAGDLGAAPRGFSPPTLGKSSMHYPVVHGCVPLYNSG